MGQALRAWRFRNDTPIRHYGSPCRMEVRQKIRIPRRHARIHIAGLVLGHVRIIIITVHHELWADNRAKNWGQVLHYKPAADPYKCLKLLSHDCKKTCIFSRPSLCRFSVRQRSFTCQRTEQSHPKNLTLRTSLHVLLPLFTICVNNIRRLDVAMNSFLHESRL